MTAKIIKLEEYLTELLDNNRQNIIQSIMSDMGVDEETAKDLNRKMTHAQELQMINAHFDSQLNDAQKLAVTHAILDPIVSVMNEQPFRGTDIAEGFNFRRIVANEVARGNIMDWLEENQIAYLIDNDGNFAVKCPDRKTQYRVNRQFEHTLNKWDSGPIGKNVDPDIHRKGLSPIVDISSVLTDTLSEDDLTEAAQDGSMPIPDMSGTPPMFPPTEHGDMTDGIPSVFENTEDGAMQVLGDLINPSATPYVEKLDEESGEWLVCDDTAERSYFVNVDDGNFEEVEYISENVGGSGPTFGLGHSGRRAGAMPGADDPRGGEHDLPTKFVHGVEVPADAVAEKNAARFKKLFQSVDLETLMDATKQEQIDLMVTHGVFSSQELEDPRILKGALAKYNQVVSDRYEQSRNVAEAKKSDKSRISAAKKKLDAMRPGKGVAGAMAQATRGKNAGPHDEKGYKRNPKHKKDTQLDENVVSGALGMTSMPTVAINRLRQLAGLPASSMTVIEEVPVQPETKNEPIVQHGNELHEIDAAIDHLNEVFNIYKTLNSKDKRELRFNLLDAIMGDGDRLSESVISALLGKKSSVLLEFDDDGEVLSEEDKEYLRIMLPDLKATMLEDIEEVDDTIRVALARVAYLLEMLQKQMDDI